MADKQSLNEQSQNGQSQTEQGQNGQSQTGQSQNSQKQNEQKHVRKQTDNNRKPGQMAALRQVLAYIRKYRILVGLSLILAAVIVALTLYVPILTGDAVDLLLGKDAVDFGKIFRIMTMIAIAVAATAAAQWVMNTCNNHITYHVVKDIREAAFHKLEQLPLKYLDNKAYGDIVSRVVADVDTFADGLLMGFTQLFTGVLTIGGTLVFMLVTNVPIALVVICITPVSFLVARFIATKTYSMFKLQSETRGEQTALIEEMIGNQKIVKAFSREEAVRNQFAEINGRLKDCSLKAIFFSSITNPATRFVNSLVYAGVGIFGAFVAIRGGISVGRLTCFLSYANQYTKPFNEISGVVTELQNALACAARIFQLIDEEPQVPDSDTALVLEKAQGNVRLENVNFSYVPDKELIRDFYDVDSGRIRVDGTDIREITRGSLRTNYGMVLQETWLRAGTIRDNIRMGKPEATDEEVIAAAKAAHAHSFIRRLSDGYDTVITEDGGSLSQGQKQLLCIARVMLCLPPMLILDEATSSIDTRTELKIQNAFAKMMEGRTSFIVAHRLSTIQEADIILVMRDGNIIEQGSHEALLAKGGFYATLYNSQFAG